MLREFHEQGAAVDVNERLRALDVVKILMGIYSDRANIRRFMNNGRIWAKL